ncbi:SLC5/6 family protein [Paenibacillus xylanivorans]|uniref:hypothetical protein n=1 Tax=Paenibacillus xylanivorans TaxID=1705561 RepID=UPI0009E6B852|nr:hypothetical protein [Paenibacillus xylanivorans]
MTAIWFLAVFVKTAASLYATVLSLSQTLNMNNYRAFTYPLSILVVVYAMLVFPNAAAYLHFLTHIWFYYSHTMLLVIPLLLFMIAWIQKERKRIVS